MKVLFDDMASLNLQKFGIHVPLTDLRAHRVKEYLENENIILSTPENATEWASFSSTHLKLAHNDQYVQKLSTTENEKKQAIIDCFELVDEKGKYNRYDPSQSEYSLDLLTENILNQARGTLQATLTALDFGESYFLGGGYHHAMSFGGRGFCLINDVVIAARWLQQNKGLKNIWIIDVDAHKGDGTAQLTENDPTIQTLSIHMADGWPLDSQKYDKEGQLNPWFIPSNIDIPIHAGQESQYLLKLEKGLDDLKNSSPQLPDMAFVVQGSDPFEKDELPSASLLKLSLEQMLQRDILVYNFLKKLNIPQVYTMSGGYGDYVYQVYCQFLKYVLKI